MKNTRITVASQEASAVSEGGQTERSRVMKQILIAAVPGALTTAAMFFGPAVAMFEGVPVESARLVAELSVPAGAAVFGITFLAQDVIRFAGSLLAKVGIGEKK